MKKQVRIDDDETVRTVRTFNFLKLDNYEFAFNKIE
jgi:hypothetical protein